MTNRTKRTFSAELKLEAAQLVTEHGYSVVEAAKSMNVSKSAMDRWVRQANSKALQRHKEKHKHVKLTAEITKKLINTFVENGVLNK